MSVRVCTAILAASVLLLWATAGEAQVRRAPREPRGFVSIGGGVQADASRTDSFSFPLHAENGSGRAGYPGAGATLLDVSAGMRVWKRIGVGAAITRSASSADATVRADVPHPFFFDRPRPVEGRATDLSRDETGVHVQLYWEPRMTGRLRLRLFAGPSWVDARQDLVEGVDVDEVYPYDEATFRSARTGRVTGSGIGGHAGADVSWMLTRRIGAGAVVRYAAAGVDLNASGTRTVSSDGGGIQAAAGVRVVF